MIKNLFSTFTLGLFVLSSLGVGELYGQSAGPGAGNNRNEEPLQMVIDYSQAPQKHRESRHGIMEPVRLPAGENVAITLKFLRKRAGDLVSICSLDGGQVDPPAPVAISPEGNVVFHFRTGRTPGLYRVAVNGPWAYELSFYAVDPAQATKPSGRH